MKLVAATYNCLAKAINLLLYEFSGVKKPPGGMVREHEILNNKIHNYNHCIF